jgi:hypothetical protein
MLGHRVAQQIIADILREIAPTRFDLLLEIIQIEELHLADQSTIAPAKVAAAIEKAAKAELSSES